MSEPIFFHVDVNSAFLSWTACDLLFNKEIDYDLRLVPSIIGGNQATRHGIVLAKSNPSKKYGITTGEPVIDAKKKCPGLIVMPPDYSLYVSRSNDLMDLLRNFTPDRNVRNKGYGNSMTIKYDVTDAEAAKHYILSLTEIVTTRIRADHALIGVVAISITDSEFRHSSHQMTLSSPTDITEKIYIAACMLFDELWDGSPIRQLGVHTSRASFEAYYQYDLFDGARIDKLRAMDLTVDSIRDRYGYESIKRACFTKE